MDKKERFWNKVSTAAGNTLSEQSVKTIELTTKHLGINDKVLDFGCGSGGITNKIAQNVKEVIAIDFSSGMIAFAKKKVKEMNIENVKYYKSTLFDEQLQANSFDVILAFNVLHYIEDLPTLLSRIHSLLKPDGLFMSATVCLNERKSFIRVLMFFLCKTGIIPKTLFFKTSELEALIKSEKFKIINGKNIAFT